MLARFTTLLLVLLAALMLAACGGDDDSTSDDGTSSDTATETTEETTTETTEAESGAQTLELTAGDELKFDKDELTATAGSVTIKLDVTGGVPHNVALESVDGEELAAGEIVAGGTSEITVDLEPGTYTYFCTPHKAAGMTGTLTVT